MNHRHWAVGLVDAPQQRQRDGMVTSQGNDTRQCPAGPREPNLVGVGKRLAHQNAVVSFLNLLNRPCVVVGCHGDIAAVHNSQVAGERVRLEGNIVSATDHSSIFSHDRQRTRAIYGELGWNVLKVETARALSDTTGPETCTWSVRSTGVEGSTCNK